ncbi:MAG: lysylphosphatidylglycerol synthase transmembrane domain-containing protein [Candidatus Alcyoniella australis]|nr:lysylphosphatidylglycerol synthase transmembrane domain-containing protein [Candidatus Alcyoniella australis]
MSAQGTMRRNILIGVVLGALVFLGVIVYSGRSELIDALGRFHPALFLALVALSFTNYLFRFAKWHYYLGQLRIRITVGRSLVVFLSGLVMTISPGKFGEVIKSYFLKQVTGTPISVSAPIVIAERLTDFFALLILAGLGFLYLTASSYRLAAAIVMALLVAVVLVIGNRRLSLWLIGLLEQFGPLRMIGDKIRTAYESTYFLTRLHRLLVATLLSVMAWACECAGFWIVLRQLREHASALSATFIYSLGTIFGAISPGGLFITEGTMLAMLQNSTLMSGVPLTPGEAGAATIVIRCATLWFAVVLGALILMVKHGTFSRAARDLEHDNQSPGEG